MSDYDVSQASNYTDEDYLAFKLGKAEETIEAQATTIKQLEADYKVCRVERMNLFDETQRLEARCNEFEAHIEKIEYLYGVKDEDKLDQPD